MPASTRKDELKAQRTKWLQTVSAVASKPEDQRSKEDLQAVQAIQENWSAHETEWNALNATEDFMTKLLGLGDLPELPISGGGKVGKSSLNLRTEPWSWTSKSQHQRLITPSQGDARFYATEDYNTCFEHFLRKPTNFRDGASLAQSLETKNIGRPETWNILRQDDDARGGIFTMPEEMMAGWLKNLDNQTFIAANCRQLAVTTSDSLGIRTRTDKANYVGPRSELGNALKNQETALKFGKRSMKTNEFGIVALMSNQLLEHAATNMWQLYLDEITLSGGEWLEQKCLTGSGVGEPLGIFTVDSANGLGLDRDVATVTADFGANVPNGWTAQTRFGFGTALRAYFAMKPQHRTKSRWMFHSNQMLNLCQMTDDSGRLVWQPSAREGEPNRLLGLPIDESLWLSGNQSADEYFGGLFNWDYYWMVWHKKMTWQALREILALQGITVMMMGFQMDAQPVLPEAFIRLKYAA